MTMEQANRSPALERLEALVGEWTMAAGPPGGDPWPGEAKVRFEWLEGETWLIERWSIEMPEAPDGIAIIGLADAPAGAEEAGGSGERLLQHYFDSRGVHRDYEMTLEDGEWKLWRDGPPFDQRFTGTFSDDGKTISCRWEIREEGKDWDTDFDLTYEKVS
jgi:hypothetical protein